MNFDRVVLLVAGSEARRLEHPHRTALEVSVRGVRLDHGHGQDLVSTGHGTFVDERMQLAGHTLDFASAVAEEIARDFERVRPQIAEGDRARELASPMQILLLPI